MTSSTLLTSATLQDRVLKQALNFVKECLRDLVSEGRINAGVPKLVLSTYDLESFIGSWNGTRVELAHHFINHCRAVEKSLTEW